MEDKGLVEIDDQIIERSKTPENEPQSLIPPKISEFPPKVQPQLREALDKCTGLCEQIQTVVNAYKKDRADNERVEKILNLQSELGNQSVQSAIDRLMENVEAKYRLILKIKDNLKRNVDSKELLNAKPFYDQEEKEVIGARTRNLLQAKMVNFLKRKGFIKLDERQKEQQQTQLKVRLGRLFEKIPNLDNIGRIELVGEDKEVIDNILQRLKIEPEEFARTFFLKKFVEKYEAAVKEWFIKNQKEINEIFSNENYDSGYYFSEVERVFRDSKQKSGTLIGNAIELLKHNEQAQTREFEKKYNSLLTELFEIADPIKETNYQNNFRYLSVSFEVFEKIKTMTSFLNIPSFNERVKYFMANVVNNLREIEVEFNQNAVLCHQTTDLIKIFESNFLASRGFQKKVISVGGSRFTTGLFKQSDQEYHQVCFALNYPYVVHPTDIRAGGVFIFNVRSLIGDCQIGNADGYHLFSTEYNANSKNDKAFFAVDLSKTPFLLAVPEFKFQQFVARLRENIEANPLLGANIGDIDVWIKEHIVFLPKSGKDSDSTRMINKDFIDHCGRILAEKTKPFPTSLRLMPTGEFGEDPTRVKMPLFKFFPVEKISNSELSS